MENRLDRLNRLADLAKAASLRDREKIERIISTSKEADNTTEQTAETMKRIMSKLDSQP